MHDSDSAPRHDPDEPDRVDRADERGKSDGSDRASGPAGGGNVGESDNIDAEFAAMMEGLSLPDEMVNEGLGLPVVDQVGPPRHVDDGLGQSLVQGHEGIAEAPDSALIA